MTCPHPNKAAFPDQASATRGMLTILSRPKAWTRPAHPVRVYLCPCGAWHFTSQGTTADTPRDVVDARMRLHGLA